MIIKARPGPKKLLHVGCGPKHPLPAFLTGDEWQEIRLDIDPNVKPDIIASITHMAAVDNASVDGVYSSHNLEHLFAHEVPIRWANFAGPCGPTASCF